MDNVTHSLLGVLLARAVDPWIGARRGALWAAILASNIPDADLLLNAVFDDAKLGYLVHHRGHTHTLVGALPLALGVAAVARWRDPEAPFGRLVALAIGAAALHLGADAWNNYGVHPFWPFDDRWYYGDFVFIVEPWLWAALLPLAWDTFRGRATRVGLAGLGLAMTALAAAAVGPVAAVAFAAVLGALGLIQRRGGGWGVPAVGVLAVLGGFGAGSRAAEATVRAAMAGARPGETVLDVALTPTPGVPWCWSGLVASRDADAYHARSLVLSQLPALTPPAACVIRRGSGERTAPMRPPDLEGGDGLGWGERFEAPFAELVTLAREECRVDAFLRYARVPWWAQEGDRLVLGDLRYDFEPELGFAEVETRRTDPPDRRGCDHLPPWRSDVARAFTGG